MMSYEDEFDRDEYTFLLSLLLPSIVFLMPADINHFYISFGARVHLTTIVALLLLPLTVMSLLLLDVAQPNNIMGQRRQ